VRVTIPGKRVIDAIVDLPFALPTAVAGIALATLYAPTGWVGGILASFGVRVAYTPAGILVAMVFIGLPFVVRTVQPVLDDIERDQEEAAATLGANPFSIFARVTLPAIGPALLSGFALAFARGVGEYGSIIFIAGNLPGQSEILPLLIVVKLQQFDYAGASAIATVMLATSFLVLITLNSIERWQQRRRFGVGA
jgi:sulfate transport system permease protein